MATNTADIAGDLRTFNEFGEAAWGRPMTKLEKQTLLRAGSLGWLQGGSIVEGAIANSSDLELDTRDYRDFDDGTDSKKASVKKAGTQPSGLQRWKANIQNVSKKKGGLRITIDASRIAPGKWIYLVVPATAYHHFQGDTLGIEIDWTGSVTGHYKSYLAKDLKEMSRSKIVGHRVIKPSHPDYHKY